VRTYTAHLRSRGAPVLVREGFSLGAMLFGPFWLLAGRAWIPALLSIAAWMAAGALPAPWPGVAGPVLAWAHGVFGRDMLRFGLERAGYRLVHVVAARDEDAALARLLAAEPWLVTEAAA
jgi:hypothetical protein